MTKEIFWLMLTVVLTGLIWVPYVLDRLQTRGLMKTLDNPGERDKAQSPWAQRMMAAHANTVENLVTFAPLVLVAHALNIRTATTALACAVFFWARLAYVVVYTAGIPMLRTVIWTVGWLAQAALALAIFKLI